MIIHIFTNTIHSNKRMIMNQIMQFEILIILILTTFHEIPYKVNCKKIRGRQGLVSSLLQMDVSFSNLFNYLNSLIHFNWFQIAFLIKSQPISIKSIIKVKKYWNEKIIGNVLYIGIFEIKGVYSLHYSINMLINF